MEEEYERLNRSMAVADKLVDGLLSGAYKAGEINAGRGIARLMLDGAKTSVDFRQRRARLVATEAQDISASAA